MIKNKTKKHRYQVTLSLQSKRYLDKVPGSKSALIDALIYSHQINEARTLAFKGEIIKQMKDAGYIGSPISPMHDISSYVIATPLSEYTLWQETIFKLTAFPETIIVLPEKLSSDDKQRWTDAANMNGWRILNQKDL